MAKRAAPPPPACGISLGNPGQTSDGTTYYPSVLGNNPTLTVYSGTATATAKVQVIVQVQGSKVPPSASGPSSGPKMGQFPGTEMAGTGGRAKQFLLDLKNVKIWLQDYKSTLGPGNLIIEFETPGATQYATRNTAKKAALAKPSKAATQKNRKQTAPRKK